MTEIEAIALIIQHLEAQFPKTCPNCQRRFYNLREFLGNAKPIGDMVSYDLELGDLNPDSPTGTLAASNCRCGSTLALTSNGMRLSRLWSLLRWATGEMHRRGMIREEFLQHLRWQIRTRVLLDWPLGP